MATDSMEQLDKQIQALMDYCIELKQENAKLHQRERLVVDTLQTLLNQFKAGENGDD